MCAHFQKVAFGRPRVWAVHFLAYYVTSDYRSLVALGRNSIAPAVGFDGTALLIALLQLQVPPRGRTFFSTSGRSRCQRTSLWKKQRRRQVQHDGSVLVTLAWAPVASQWLGPYQRQSEIEIECAQCSLLSS